LEVNIPLPVKPQKYSGKIVLRMPHTMHESLIHMADLEGVSLNQYMLTSLARTVGLDQAQKITKKQSSPMGYS